MSQIPINPDNPAMPALPDCSPVELRGVYLDRRIGHRYMGNPKDFPCCDGLGWTYAAKAGTENDEIPDVIEVFCSCEAGKRRREVES